MSSSPVPGEREVLRLLAWAIRAGYVWHTTGRGGILLEAPPGALPLSLRPLALAHGRTLSAALRVFDGIPPTLAQLAAWWLFELQAMDEDRRELFEERAAVREYEAGFPRAVAELVALADVLLGYETGGRPDTNTVSIAINAVMEAA